MEGETEGRGRWEGMKNRKEDKRGEGLACSHRIHHAKVLKKGKLMLLCFSDEKIPLYAP